MTALNWSARATECTTTIHAEIFQECLSFSIVSNEVHLSVLGKNLVALGMEKLCARRAYDEFVSQSLALPDP
jgi:hypothetical protein